MGFGKDGKGVIIHEDVQITVGALSSQATIFAVGGITIGEDFRILKTEISVLQSSAGVGAVGDAVLIGVADGELSVGEIAQAINASGPTDRNDNLGNEQSMRPVWTFVAMQGDSLTIPN